MNAPLARAMRPRLIGVWLGLAVAAVALSLPATARATTNVVPNPGFEQGGCGSTPVICGWEKTGSDPNAFMYQDAPHSGSASMLLGWAGETGGGFLNWYGAQAETDPAHCAAIGPGAHPASFWLKAGDGESVWFGAIFYQGADCTGAASSDSLDRVASGVDWQQLTGTVVAPSGTKSALFQVGVLGWCDNYSGCLVSANFDDLDVEDAVVTTPAISSFTPANGPVGTSVDIVGVNFTGATAVSFNATAASFTVDSDSEIHATVPSGATSGPISVTTPNGTGSSHSSFGVTPTISSFTPTSGPVGTSVAITGSDFTGTTSVTFAGTPASFTVNSPASITATVPGGATTGPISVTTPIGAGTSLSSFTVIPNAPPIAGFTFSCTALACSFDGGASSDPDGTIQTYSWNFGEGTSGSGKNVAHSYAHAAAYSVTLTVTDNAGATASESQTVTLMSLSARGYKVHGLEKVDLSWSGPGGTSFDIYRNGAKIATVQASPYTDNLNTRGSATYTYRACAPAASTCSNDASVTF